MRLLAIGSLAGFLAGLIAGGVGSRIAMRISAITAGPDKLGALTEAQARVGEITLGGSLFLIINGGAIGVIGGLMYLALRPWVSDAGRWRGLAFGMILLGLLGSAVIRGENFDFYEFGPPWLNIGTFATLFPTFGILLVPLFDRLDRGLPPVSLRPAGLASLTAQGFGLLLLLPGSLAGLSFSRPVHHILAIYVIVGIPIASALLARSSGRFDRLADLRDHRGARALALAVLVVPLVGGLILNVQEITEIFAAQAPY